MDGDSTQEYQFHTKPLPSDYRQDDGSFDMPRFLSDQNRYRREQRLRKAARLKLNREGYELKFTPRHRQSQQHYNAEYLAPPVIHHHSNDSQNHSPQQTEKERDIPADLFSHESRDFSDDNHQTIALQPQLGFDYNSEQAHYADVPFSMHQRKEIQIPSPPQLNLPQLMVIDPLGIEPAPLSPQTPNQNSNQEPLLTSSCNHTGSFFGTVLEDQLPQ